MSLYLCLKPLHVVHIKVFQRLLLFYSLIFQSRHFPVCHFSVLQIPVTQFFSSYWGSRIPGTLLACLYLHVQLQQSDIELALTHRALLNYCDSNDKMYALHARRRPEHRTQISKVTECQAISFIEVCIIRVTFNV